MPRGKNKQSGAKELLTNHTIMPKGITIDEAASRLEQAGLNFSARYEKGAAGKGSKWQSGASKAAPNYKDGVTRAMSSGKFEKGVAEAGPTAYDEGVRTKGITNWPTGMQVSGPKYQRKTQKFAALWNQPLPTPRGAKRSPTNLKRMAENVDRFQKIAG